MARFVPNRNLDNELRREVRYKVELLAAAKDAETAAKSFAPVRTGAYRDGIKAQIQGGDVVLSATDFKSHWIEWGSANNPPSAPLRRGVRAVGLKFRASK